MRKYLILAFLAACFMASTAAQVQYTGKITAEEVMMNTTIGLECSTRCPVSRWTLTWTVPENSEIVSIRDSYGKIEDYEKTGRSVSITTNSGEPRRSETVKVRIRIDEPAEKMYEDLRYRKISLPSFSEEETSGRFQVKSLISGWIGYGFQESFSEDSFTFKGEGPTNIRVNFGEGIETRYYEFFGEDRDNSSEAYRLAIGTTGIVQGYQRMPVAVMDDKSYNRSVNRWSSGEYMAGAITLRDDLDKHYLPVLTHETIHGLNDEFLRWDQTRSTYLDEGVAEHAEFLMKKKLYSEERVETGTRELFGDEVQYTVRKDGKRYTYTLPPNGDKEVLWNYYQQDQDFMKTWSAGSSEQYRQFGYAYSELIIKHYIVNNGSIRQLYSFLGPGNKISSPEEKWEYLSNYLDMTPCKYDSRERFNRCLEEINSYDYPVYSATTVPGGNQEIEFQQIKIPNRTEEKKQRKRNRTSTGKVSFSDFLRGFIDYLLSFL